MVPTILIDERQFDISLDLSSLLNVSDKLVVGDEIWCFQYDPETKYHSKERKLKS